MLDPGLEHLHRHGRLWRENTRLHRWVRHLRADAPLLPLAVALIFLGPDGRWASPWVVASLIGIFALASLVRFEVGSLSTSPYQLVLVPLWFAVPPGWLVPCVALGLVLGGVVEHVRDGHDGSIWRRLLSAGDSWPAVGPAVVLSLAGAPEASTAATPVVILAFAAQVAIDGVATMGGGWILQGVRPRVQARLIGWIAIIDASLAPIGFVVAIAMTTQPAAIVAIVPLVAITGEFARERAERIEQALQLSAAYRGTAQLMGDVLEADHSYTGGEHTQGVVDMAVAVGLELHLDPASMRDLEFGALLHDVDKLRVPNEIINKPGPLDDREWAVIRLHPQYGQEMLDRVGGVLHDAGRIVRAHHERWDGAGYPDGLANTEIPLEARIITACDSFSAMTTRRAYSAAVSVGDALDELRRCAGSQFDPAVVSALCVVVDRVGTAAALGQQADGGVAPVAAALGLRPIA